MSSRWSPRATRPPSTRPRSAPAGSTTCRRRSRRATHRRSPSREAPNKTSSSAASGYCSPMTLRRALAALLGLATLTLAVPAHAASGALDTSFDGDGRFSFGLGNPAEEGASGMAVDPSGRLIVGEGMFGSNMAVARVLGGGGLDPTFAGGVAQLTDGNPRSTNTVAVQPDGKVLAAGNDTDHLQNVFLVRYRANGTPDPNFGASGIAHVQVCGTS